MQQHSKPPGLHCTGELRLGEVRSVHRLDQCIGEVSSQVSQRTDWVGAQVRSVHKIGDCIGYVSAQARSVHRLDQCIG